MKRPTVAQLAFFSFFLMLVGSIGFVLYVWRSTMGHVEHLAVEASDDVHVADLKTSRDNAQALLRHINTSSSALAKMLSSDSFSSPNFQVPQAIFLAFKALSPILTQVSFAREDGFLFSYMSQENGSTFSIFSNTSSSPSGFFAPCCYNYQAADPNSGIQLGTAISASLAASMTAWLNNAFSHTHPFVSLVSKWVQAEDHLVLITSPLKVVMAEKALSAVISLGISVQRLLNMIDNTGEHGGSMFLVLDDGHVLQKNGNIPNWKFFLDDGLLSIHMQNSTEGDTSKESVIYCGDGDSFVDFSELYLGGKLFKFRCASLHLGKDVVLVQGFPRVRVINHAHTVGAIGYFLLLSALLLAVFTCAIIYRWILKYQRRDMLLRSSLIKQKEATQQAERKSMNKSLAFASASHDIRTSLVGIAGLIELCQTEVSPESEMEKNLVQMSICASKLFGILNSVLDMSKVEAGKMQLKDAEFDISKLIEESVDIFHIVALKKGLEVIWDPCDGSVLSSPRVKGDSGRVKEILDNLLSNAVKFTSEGHVLVKAWARRINPETLTRENSYNCNFSHVQRPWSCFSAQKADVFGDIASICSPACIPNSIELVFEVDDTGVGIPKDKRESIFENFVQVNESANEPQGTGLGLGIVQSYVRLMGGEIGIVDKGVSERGTCFRFNLLLKSAEAADGREDQELEDLPTCSTLESKRRNRKIFQGNLHGVILIQGEETKRILGSWLESVGVRVWAVDHFELLLPTIEKIVGQKPISFSEEVSSQNKPGEILECRATQVEEHHRNSPSFSAASVHILIFIDMGFGVFGRNPDFSFSNNLCRVVWLVNSNTPGSEIRSLKNKEVQCDLLLHKPLHGSRLQAILDLLHGLDQPKELSPKNGESSIPIQSDEPLSGLRVLLAEDNSVLRRLTSLTLAGLGATVDTCENGREAVELVRRAVQERWQKEDERVEKKCIMPGSHQRPPYDMIFMDCEMPVMNGYQATRQIREEEKRYGLRFPIIALTAHAFGDQQVEFFEAGMDFHLMKPLQPAILMDIVKHLNIV
ncbi:signal transduction histidine kinase [Wolffia australiana]